MMKQFRLSTITFLLLVSGIVLPFTLNAEELASQSSNIFKFQQKLALNGNVHAQYKLASMYEMGDGISADIEQAKHWYGRAAEAGSIPARQRNIYLTVKEQGYNPAKNAAWLDGVKTAAAEHQGQAMFLLGQLYSEGIGVEKNLDKSLELLNQVRILGVANVDMQIAAIRDEIAAKKAARQEAARAPQKKQSQQAATEQPLSAEEQAIRQAEKEEKLKRQAEAEQAEKIRRYEQAMIKLKWEQQLIEEQQAWATGGDGTVDDEI